MRAQRRRLEHVDARIDLGDGCLVLGRVLLLDDPAHRTVGIADDAPVARRIRQRRAEHGGRRGAVAVATHQARERVGLEERHVSAEHEHIAVESLQFGERELDRAPGAGHLVLIDDDAHRVPCRGRPRRPGRAHGGRRSPRARVSASTPCRAHARPAIARRSGEGPSGGTTSCGCPGQRRGRSPPVRRRCCSRSCSAARTRTWT